MPEDGRSKDLIAKIDDCSGFSLMSQPTLPYWLKYLPHNDVASTELLPESADVVIVGSGISGCSAAYHLKNLKPDLKIVVLEARTLSAGATGRNGGLLVPWLNADWDETVRLYGKKGARDVMRFEYSAIQDVVNFIKSHSYEDYVKYSPFKDGAMDLFLTRQEMDLAAQELKAMQEEGLEEGVRLWSAEEVRQAFKTSAFVGALQLPGAGRVWAARLVSAIAREAFCTSPATCNLFENCKVEEMQQIDENGFKWKVLTSRGPIKCCQVAYCTNGYGTKLVPQLVGAVQPTRNQVVVTPPLAPGERLPLDAAFSARNRYMYFSTREDGRVVIGGGRDAKVDLEWGVTDDGSLDPEVSASLRGFLPTYFPKQFSNVEYEMEWSGILGFTPDRFPIVGPIPGMPAAFVCSGYSGHGMTRAYSCARALAHFLAGHQLPYGFPDVLLTTYPGRLERWRAATIPKPEPTVVAELRSRL